MQRVRARGIAAHVRAGAAAFPCQVEDFSDEGAFLRTDRRLVPGLSIEVDLVKPGARKALHIHARTSRAAERGPDGHSGIDVQFVSMEPDDRQRLCAWIEGLSMLPPPKEVALPPPRTAKDRAAAIRPVEAAPAAAPVQAPPPSPDTAKLMIQVKGLLLEMDDLRYQLREREADIEDLRRQLATAEQLLGRRS